MSGFASATNLFLDTKDNKTSAANQNTNQLQTCENCILLVSVALAVVLGDDAGVLRVGILVDVAAHREAGCAVLLVALHGIAPCYLKVKHKF